MALADLEEEFSECWVPKDSSQGQPHFCVLLIKLKENPGPRVLHSPGSTRKMQGGKEVRVWVSAALGSAQEFFS
jgi:hypothetical protein